MVGCGKEGAERCVLPVDARSRATENLWIGRSRPDTCGRTAPRSRALCQSGSVSIHDPDHTPVAFDCPRCARPTTATFWGPCDACRSELRATQGGDARDIEVAAYEPKMNVTPNAVATKD